MVSRSISISIGRKNKENTDPLSPEAWREIAAEAEKVKFDNPLQDFIAEFRQGKNISPYKLARKLHLTSLVAPAHAEKQGVLMFFPTEWVLVQYSNHIIINILLPELSFPITNYRKCNVDFLYSSN